jgi:uncharacterized protein with NAD-binding domain and iron-sulfur cluster
MNKVIIAGGGVAGMSAAHELIDRGFAVEVYEQQPVYVGGKARSTGVPGTAAPGKKPLPGEHGFRFFPGFYKHITDTMKRIPFEGNQRGVYDNLVATKRIAMGREGMNEIINLVNFPKSIKDIKVMWHAVKDSNTGLTDNDIDTIANKIWQLMTSCRQRRLAEYEKMAWWEFTEAAEHSDQYREFFVGGITRTLVAAKPRKVSTRTGGDILLQLLFQMSNFSKPTDRVLNGPTNEAWLYPWRDYLIERGVKYNHNAITTGIKSKFDKTTMTHTVTGIEIKDEHGHQKIVTGDYYIAAVPVEVMAGLIDENLLAGDRRLESIQELANDVAWMTGMQFYLNEDVRVTAGHIMIIDSPWGITAISQPQFWEHVDMNDYGDGKVKGVLSVDISDWEKPGYNGKMAKECSKQEIMEEVWCQLVLGIRKDGQPLFSKGMVVACNLDRDIQYKPGENPDPNDHSLDVHKLKDCTSAELQNVDNPSLSSPPETDPSGFKTIDKEPLLINRVRTWDLRPNAYCKIPNLFLAADYVQTYTDLATMEGANEAARRAVNAILDATDSPGARCKLWELHEPWLLWPFRYYDKRRFKKGLPWNEEFPWLFKLVHLFMQFIGKLMKAFA